MTLKLPILTVIACCVVLAGCGDKKPTEDEAFQMGKKEISMALCGDKSASCFLVEGGSAKISEKKTDGTYGASVTFTTLKGKDSVLKYQAGSTFFDIDAKTNEVYVRSIDAWSKNGSSSIALCGRNYKFCSK